MLRALVVDDDETLRMTVRAAVESRGYQVEEAEDGVAAMEMFAAKGPFDVVLLDVNMPRMNGLDALAKIKETNPKTLCLVMTAYSNVKCAVTAIKNGAYDYIEKPVDGDRILSLIDAAMAASNMVEVAAYSAPQLQLQFAEDRPIIGSSSPMNAVFDIIYRLSKVETTVLIRGESGTGKELVARAIHFNSHRKKGPFVAVNLAAIPENLIESELFGHEKGSFTGADKRKLGKFQFAAGGTLFLDEIGDISQQMQVKILRVLQEKRLTPVGSNQEEATDVRIIAATSRPLEKMIETNTFRADLFYRLNVMPIHLPSLRDRREDIASLTDYMIKKFNDLHGRSIQGIDKLALNALRLHSWPGNIRELENVIEHAFIMEPSATILSLASLPEHLRLLVQKREGASTTMPAAAMDIDTNAAANAEAETSSNLIGDFAPLNYPVLKEKFEREFIVRALKAFNGRINQTAEHTQMTKVTLLRKLEKYGINPREYQRH